MKRLCRIFYVKVINLTSNLFAVVKLLAWTFACLPLCPRKKIHISYQISYFFSLTEMIRPSNIILLKQPAVRVLVFWKVMIGIWYKVKCQSSTAIRRRQLCALPFCCCQQVRENIIQQKRYSICKCNLPITNNVRLLVGRSVCRFPKWVWSYTSKLLSEHLLYSIKEGLLIIKN